ncbi:MULTISPECIES: c-type cytochrome biogenesis protein CcmI [unclassified Aureimonas]|uniref:c-type cytochrome biogenesis protein CcmI n=1 Tax=unclassified Aureimonas TaxID=2615206 RepID=UPI0006F1CBE7|nr:MULTISPECIES: c-type cytochrome biogenesis protein CcmI [unclassified Aureimonas]KQT55280.1 hypothetical protein ASG62_10655 [Aureimonas sp. Leaf427]KQT71072.1 hypothetical protein ASG54_21040 [Aureimonas sp. Leaf460]
MLFWIIAGLLTVVVVASVLFPILRKSPAEAPARAEHDAEIYAAQLRELDADLKRGAIAAEDAAVARAEIGRRLLKASAAETTAAFPRHRAALAASVFAVGLGVPAASLYGYVTYGSPALPDRPLAARLAVDPAMADLPTLVAQVEAKLRAKPDDGAGWDMLAPIYLRSGRPEDAVRAVSEAIRLLGATPEREATRGEALVQLASGEVTDEAKASFQRALALNPDFLPAKFFLALDLSQENRFAEAAPAWRDLVAKSPPGAPWLEIAQLAIDDAEKRLAGGPGPAPVQAPGQPGPAPEDVAAAAAMPQADRLAMIQGMVSQLADRLKSAPNDAEGWKRLMQSYTVLGDGDRARGAFAEASAVFAEGTAERRDIEAFAAGLGIGTPPPSTMQ